MSERQGHVTAAPDDSQDVEERRRVALLHALGELPARDREVLSLRYGAGLTAAEVAAQLHLGVANVRKICQRRRPEILRRVVTLAASDDALASPPPRPDDEVPSTLETGV